MRNAKADILEGLLADHAMVQVWFHTRTHGETVVPPHLGNRDAVMFEIGLNMPIPIPDLRIADGGFSATLSIQRAPFTVTVLWDAVFMLAVMGEGMVVFDEARMKAAGLVPPPVKGKRKLPPGWAVIEGGKQGAEEPTTVPPKAS